MFKPFGELTNFDNILEFDVREFLKDFDKQLWQEVQKITMEELEVNFIIEP